MVEDEEQVLNTNCRMLRRRGYDVRTAQTVSEACQQIEEQLPDLLILDIMLPDGNGLDICRRFREKTMNPVLFLTGKSDIRDRVEGLQQGGDYYLTKPYNFDEFLAVIQMLLERQKRMEEKIKENLPKVAIICEYDAMPEIGHGCGHSASCAAGIICALAIKEEHSEYRNR
mgnify:FL=1